MGAVAVAASLSTRPLCDGSRLGVRGGPLARFECVGRAATAVLGQVLSDPGQLARDCALLCAAVWWWILSRAEAAGPLKY